MAVPKDSEQEAPMASRGSIFNGEGNGRRKKLKQAQAYN